MRRLWITAWMVCAGCAAEKATGGEEIDAQELGGVGSGSTGPAETEPDPGGGGSTVGAQLGDAFTDGVWSLDTSRLEWESGEELGLLVTELIWQLPMFGAGTLESGNRVTLQAGLSEDREGGQDLCVPTDTLSGTLNTDGTLFVETELATLPAQDFGLDVHLVDVSFRGTINAETGGLDDLAMSASWDARLDVDGFGELVGSSDPDELCDVLTGFGARCDACDDGQPYCVFLAFADSDTVLLDTDFQPVDEGCR